MASLSLSLSSLCLNKNPNSLGFSSKASRCLTFGSPNVLYTAVNKFAGVRVPAVCRASSLVFPNLQADDFRHPLDKQNTQMLRAIPGLNEIGKVVRGIVAVEPLFLENIGTSVLVTPNQLSGLHELMVEAAKILNVEPPLLYIRQSPVPYAGTVAISDKMPFVVVHTSLVELLTREELQAVFAHELGHLKCDHCVWLTFADILAHGAKAIPGLGWLISQSVEEQLVRWRQAAELTCDRASLLVAQDPKVVISVMMKITGGCPSLADQLNVDAFLAQARSYDKASLSPPGWYVRNAHATQLSHPVPVIRASEIDEWSRSLEYKAILTCATHECYKEDVERMAKKNLDQVDFEKIWEQVDVAKIREQLKKPKSA
ncbi:hypothetical protein M0R45_033831 [Rubus argutus]|uniref:Peptidase M48 domain-containing protein n=1 Tax=Rubus argutus TaxID=59490 RepID=A0AAW1WL17_RUBAR